MNLRPDRVFFVVSGSCHLVRELIVIRRQLSKKKYKYILPSDEFTTRARNGDVKLDNPKDSIEQHYLIVHKLSKGDVFNTGECLEGMNYVTDRQVWKVLAYLLLESLVSLCCVVWIVSVWSTDTRNNILWKAWTLLTRKKIYTFDGLWNKMHVADIWK